MEWARTLYVLSVCMASCHGKFLGRQSESIDDVHSSASETYRSLQEGPAPSGQPNALNGSSPLPQNVSAMYNQTDHTAGRWVGAPTNGPIPETVGIPAKQIKGSTHPRALCPLFADQFYNRCPVPDLPRHVPEPGGPVGNEPEPKALRALTDVEMLLGAENGECTIEDESSVSAIKDIIGNHTLHDWLKTHHEIRDSFHELEQGLSDDAKDLLGRRLLQAGRKLNQAPDPGNVIPPSAPNQNATSYLDQNDYWAIGNSNMMIAPIHVQLTRDNTILMIDRIFYGSEAPNPYNVRAAEYTVSTNSVRNVTGIQTNSWCSAGAALFGGQVINFGGGGDNTGDNAGGNSIRRFTPCTNGKCEIVEDTTPNPVDRLLAHRWYLSTTVMPDGRALITSGQDQDITGQNQGNSFEVYPRNASNPYENNLDYMQTPINWNDPPTTGIDLNFRQLYPHVHLLPTGEWYLQQRNQWYVAHIQPGNSTLTKGPGALDPRWPDGGTPNTYPGEGNSFIMPLEPPYETLTIVSCGATWAYFQPGVNPDPDCSIITPTDTIPVADRSRLSQLNPRIMNYCVYMLDGNVGCLGGSATGSAGYYAANAPVYAIDILNTQNLEWVQGASATVARLYHAVATLTLSGSIWTGGTNPQGGYYFQYDPANSVYPAELRSELYYPWYFAVPRPVINSISNTGNITYGATFTASVQLTGLGHEQTGALIMPGFSTHNQMYSQRYIKVNACCTVPSVSSKGVITSTCTIKVPGNRNVAPPGDYILTVLDAGVPSQGKFVSIGP